MNCQDTLSLINQYGVEVELETMNLSSTLDAWYDTSTNWSTSTITVVWQGEVRRDVWFLNGLLAAGDAIVFTKPDQSINMRDRLVKSSVSYEVVAITKTENQGTVVSQKLAVKRMCESGSGI